MVHMMDNSPSLPSTFPPYLRSHCDRSMSSKRARSPETADGYGDRPVKRPSLAVGEFNRRHLSRSSASSSRQGSEDWVQRAGGLAIDSPASTPGESHFPFLPHDDGVVGEEGDIDMVMDSEENENRMVESQEHVGAYLPELQASSTSQRAEVSYQQQSHQYLESLQTPHRHQYPTRYSERKQSSMIPLIDVVPATPTPHSLLQHYQSGASNNGNDLFLSDSASISTSFSPMAVSPPTLFAQIGTPTKKRVVFGPRANCEKCRLGVPGHFSHYE
ncbi:hypothetical protein BDN70DRAFT_881275 [Pholiota conissans]|uniref:Uncharacterized protein n=1 Tax=Pholiota conissans TaxID=109636 RepID=A0A9P5YX74_9AGAR|nr:hypothetical protein BDN70DRAFT_881275 [Pholiota conissans]